MGDPTPADVPPKGFKRGLQEGLSGGRKAGREEMRKEVIDYLQEKYMGEGRPDRDSPEARAILELTRDLMEHFRGR